jgi:DNA-binding NtrC family response regulator
MKTKKLIFIVDDDQFINKLVSRRFTTDDCTVEAFEFGEDCLKVLDRDPDLVILDYFFVNGDVKMMNGMEVFNRIKEVKPTLPVIILSGQEKGEIVLELARKGISDYIIKDNNLIDNLQIAIDDLFQKN